MNPPQVAAFGHSHAGSVRSVNQDSMRFHAAEDDMVEQHGLLYAIADGMGGYEHGGVASELALETFFTTFYSGRAAKPTQKLKQGIDTANLAVCQTAQRMGARMGTTLSAINLTGEHVHIAHIGDSRVYRVRGGKAVCLTNDHTAVGELVRMKLLSPDKVRTHDRRSVLEKCLGLQLFVQPDISTHVVSDDDYLILCTDGVWAFVQDAEFAQITTDVKHPERISQSLIDMAMARESDDNVSALVIHIQKLADASATHASSRGRGFTQLIRSRFSGKA